MSKLDIANKLKKDFRFLEAREELKSLEPIDIQKLSADNLTKYYHLLSQCYYQDESLPSDVRFKKALNNLDKLKESQKDISPFETQRLKGAIYKRWYEYSKEPEHLQKAIDCYSDVALNDPKDYGYGASNATYLLLKQDSTKNNENIEKITQQGLESLGTKSKKELGEWDYASYVNLYLVAGEYDKAKEKLKEYVTTHYENNKNNTYSRDFDITIKQLISLYKSLKDPNKISLEELFDIHNITVDSASIHDGIIAQKVGLAFSGGGFRASLFHIGTLMRLAELGILNQVQVISTVSGGSIVGMMYYLMLKREFEQKGGQSIDYIKLVDELKEKFLQGVQENIRMLTFAQNDGDLTKKLGELYQEELYDSISNDTPKYMKDISITPKDFDEFDPHFHNFLLQNKVPRIIINATLLNNGHNWQFTERGMGENDYMYDKTVDKNLSYPFKSYDDICGDITIAQAIASSSAVPGLFDPVEIPCHNAWEDCDKKDILRISDGGVYDNLGLASLVADECSHIIISDGSKQMLLDKRPSTFRLDVISRTNDILMTKNRDAEYRYAKYLQQKGIIKGLSIIHMKEDVNDDALNCLFDRTSMVRTDLDAFNQIESDAIVFSGYYLTKQVFNTEEKVNSFGIKREKIVDLDHFSKFYAYYNKNTNSVLHTLDNASNVLGKAWHLVPKTYLYGIPFILMISLVTLVWWLPFSTLFIVTSMIVSMYIFQKEHFKPIVKFFFNKVIGWIMEPVAKWYLKYINPKYLSSGVWDEK